MKEPGRGQARVRHTAVGLNYIDTYHRTGLYPTELPMTPGMEGAGVVEAVGEGVTDLAPGQRVAYAGGPPGAYAEVRLIPADRLVPLPDDIDDQTAAAMMLKGMTAEYLLRRTYAVSPGETILWHAAAGRRPDRVPVGRISWCQGDRYDRVGREGGARGRPRL